VVVARSSATSPGRSRCPARAQAVNREVESTGLAARLEWGSFQHLRGSLFCGARAKSALADLGCGLFHWLPVGVRGDRVTHRATNGRRPPCAGIGTKVSPIGVKKSAGTGLSPGLLLDSIVDRSTFWGYEVIEVRRAEFWTFARIYRRRWSRNDRAPSGSRWNRPMLGTEQLRGVQHTH
jgi:hypothetical protein